MIPMQSSMSNAAAAYLTFVQAKNSAAHLNSALANQSEFPLEPRAPFSLSTVQSGSKIGVGLEWTSQGWSAKAWSRSSQLVVNNLKVFDAPLEDGDFIETEDAFFRFRSSAQSSNSHLTSKNAAFASQLELLKMYARTQFPILISGPSGSGKEVLAQAAHDQSTRSAKPFVAMNCSALSEALIESELFGHVKGSFTGAQSNRLGAFEAARGGTLFLDEIGDLPMSLQPKLLRALENSEIRPVGSDRTVKTDVRIIAATHKDLGQAIARGLFREDLYWRLQVCLIDAPPLAKRPDDLLDLIHHFSKKYRVGFTLAALDVLQHHSWPGNVRELKNTICRAAAIGAGRQVEADETRKLISHLAIARPQQVSAVPNLGEHVRPGYLPALTPESNDLGSAPTPSEWSQSIASLVSQQISRGLQSMGPIAESHLATEVLPGAPVKAAESLALPIGARPVDDSLLSRLTMSGLSEAQTEGSTDSNSSSVAPAFESPERSIRGRRQPNHPQSKKGLLAQIERDLIIRRLQANHGNQRQTAIDLGLPKSTLHDRIKAYNIPCFRRPKSSPGAPLSKPLLELKTESTELRT